MSELPKNVASPASKSARRARRATAAAATLVLMAGLGACSATPDAVKPGLLYGDTAAADTPDSAKGFPSLADTPDKRPDATSVNDQKAIAEGLAADRDTARDNDTALKSGKEPQAAKPSGAALKAAALAAENEPVSNPVAVAAAAAVPEAAPAPYVATPAQAPVAAKAAAAAPAPAPVAAAVPAPVPASEPIPARVAAAPVRAPAPEFATEEPMVETAARVEAPLDRMAMADTTTPVEETAPALETRSLIVNGVVPMPSRGGHKTYAEVKSKLFGQEEVAEAPAASAEPEAKTDEEAPVTAAPTKKVIVKPVVGAQP
tara:strand:- start:16 stop:966 length:951 start_codon:yes stop_codon:yes gene_type:complete